MLFKVSAVIGRNESGCYAYCPQLEGCQTPGDSLEEVLSNIKEAIELYLETLSEFSLQAKEHKLQILQGLM